MAALTPVVATRGAGADVSTLATAGAGGDTFPAGPNSFLRVKNGSASAVTVTVTQAAGSGPLGTTIAPLALAPTVAATTGDRLYGPFPIYPFGDANGNVNVSYAPYTATISVLAINATD